MTTQGTKLASALDDAIARQAADEVIIRRGDKFYRLDPDGAFTAAEITFDDGNSPPLYATVQTALAAALAGAGNTAAGISFDDGNSPAIYTTVQAALAAAIAAIISSASDVSFDDGSSPAVYTNVQDALAAALASSGSSGGGSAENLIINGGFRVSQRGTTFDSTTNYPNDDEGYTLDRWLLLSDGNDVLDVSQETTTVPDQSYAAVKLDVETANKRAGLCQLIEARDARAIIGDVASLSFQARAGGSNSTVDTVRVIIASWTGTEDVISDGASPPGPRIISGWGSEGGNPTLISGWTIEGSQTFSLTSSFQEFTLENISIDTAGAKNVALILMIENDDGTIGDLVYISDVNLIPGASAQSYVARPIAQEQNICERFFESYSAEDEANVLLAIGQAHTTMQASFALRLKTEKRIIPAFSVNNVAHWAFVNASFSLFEEWTSVDGTFLAKWGGRITASGSSGNLVAGNATMLLPSATGGANARMWFDAEL